MVDTTELFKEHPSHPYSCNISYFKTTRSNDGKRDKKKYRHTTYVKASSLIRAKSAGRRHFSMIFRNTNVISVNAYPDMPITDNSNWNSRNLQNPECLMLEDYLRKQ